MNDYYADGEQITANDRYEAARLFEKKFEIKPEIVRDWDYENDTPQYMLSADERRDVCAIGDEKPEHGAEWGDWTSDDVNNIYCPDHNAENPTSDNYEAA